MHILEITILVFYIVAVYKMRPIYWKQYDL